jgi:hypothetical protein
MRPENASSLKDEAEGFEKSLLPEGFSLRFEKNVRLRNAPVF